MHMRLSLEFRALGTPVSLADRRNSIYNNSNSLSTFHQLRTYKLIMARSHNSHNSRVITMATGIWSRRERVPLLLPLLRPSAYTWPLVPIRDILTLSARHLTRCLWKAIDNTIIIRLHLYQSYLFDRIAYLLTPTVFLPLTLCPISMTIIIWIEWFISQYNQYRGFNFYKKLAVG